MFKQRRRNEVESCRKATNGNLAYNVRNRIVFHFSSKTAMTFLAFIAVPVLVLACLLAPVLLSLGERGPDASDSDDGPPSWK